MTKIHKKLLFILALVSLLALLWILTRASDGFFLASVQARAVQFKEHAAEYYLPGVLLFVGVFVLVNLFFPAGAVLILLAGFLYGTLLGALYADAAAVLGAWLAFEISRHVAGNWIQHQWQDRLAGFNRELQERGSVYLFFIRMVPMMPYLLVNYMAGLTPVRLCTFLWTTALGSLPGILIFSYAGRQLLSITSVEQAFTPKVIFAFSLMVCFFIVIVIVKLVTVQKQKQKAGPDS